MLNFLGLTTANTANGDLEDESSFEQDDSMQLDTPEGEQPSPSSQATLVDLLVKAFPDSMIKAPQIVIVGSQSSGKTKLIISMIFLNLIRHPHFTDEMGNILLQVFRTGSGLMTRRPIQVSLLHSPDRDNCLMSFRYNRECLNFGDPELPNFINRLHAFDGDEIFETPLEITIRAYQLPNIQFTDMPGLRTSKVSLADAREKSLNNLVSEWIANKSNTVVAVESATHFSAGGVDSSLLHPIMEEIAFEDSALNTRSILVLTKCDKITPSAFASDVLSIYDQPQIVRLYPCIVCVVNKIDGQPEPHSIPFTEFRHIFEETKKEEQRIFSERGNLNVNVPCTTLAVINKINDIFRTLLSQALHSGYENIQGSESTLRCQIQLELAPPANLYCDQTPTNEQPFSKDELIKDLASVVIECAKTSISAISLFEDTESEFGGNEGLLLQLEVGLKNWPTIELGNIENGLVRREFFEKVKRKMEKFLRLVLSNINQICLEDASGAFSKSYLSFHHLHRFSKLKTVFQNELAGWCMRNESNLLDMLEKFMQMAWMRVGHMENFNINNLVATMHEARHYIIIECVALLEGYLKGLQFNWARLDILEESSDYVNRRGNWNMQYERVLLQQKALEECLSILKSNEHNSEHLESLILRTRDRLEALVEPTLHWEASFWKKCYQNYKEQQRLLRQQQSSLRSTATTQLSQSHTQSPSRSTPIRNAPANDSVHNGASYNSQNNILTSVISHSSDYLISEMTASAVAVSAANIEQPCVMQELDADISLSPQCDMVDSSHISSQSQHSTSSNMMSSRPIELIELGLGSKRPLEEQSSNCSDNNDDDVSDRLPNKRSRPSISESPYHSPRQNNLESAHAHAHGARSNEGIFNQLLQRFVGSPPAAPR